MCDRSPFQHVLLPDQEEDGSLYTRPLSSSSEIALSVTLWPENVSENWKIWLYLKYGNFCKLGKTFHVISYDRNSQAYPIWTDASTSVARWGRMKRMSENFNKKNCHIWKEMQHLLCILRYLSQNMEIYILVFLIHCTRDKPSLWNGGASLWKELRKIASHSDSHFRQNHWILWS